MLNQHVRTRRRALLAIWSAFGIIAAVVLFGGRVLAPTTAAAEGPTTGPQHIVVKKTGVSSDDGAGKVYWHISITNPNSETATLTMTDCPDDWHTCQTAPFAHYEGTTGDGSCTSPNPDDIQTGIACQVNAGGTLVVNVSTDILDKARCHSEEVVNSASVTQSKPDVSFPNVPVSATFELPANGGEACNTPHTPNIHITKTPSTTTLPAGGGNVTYTYTVTNPGNVPLTNVTVSDDHCGPVTYQSGDTSNANALDQSETWTYSCTQNLTASTTNVATATGHDGETTVSDTDSASVTVEQAQTVTQTITVMKVLSPGNDSGTFDLTIDGTTVASGVGNGGSGSRQVGPGQHSVGEVAHSGTSLANYTVTYSANCADGLVTVTAGQNVTCTITNTRNRESTPPPPITTVQTFNPPVVVVTETPTATPTTVTPTPTKQPTEAPKTPTEINTVLGEKTPGPAATPKAPEAGGGTTFNWFHSNQALIVIAIFLLSAFLSGAVVLTTGKKE